MTTEDNKLSLSQILGFLGLVVLLLAFAGILVEGSQNPKTSEYFQGLPAPGFELTGFNGEFEGRAFSLEDLRGQIVVVNFWASWCVECEKEMEALEQAWQTYRDRGVWILGVNYQDLDEKALAMIDRYGITYPNGPDRRSLIANQYHVRGIPETVFIDPEGFVSHVQIGAISRIRIRMILEQMLADAKPTLQ